MTLRVDRRQVLGYRIMAQGLDRTAGAATDVAVLDLGVQDTNVGSARLRWLRAWRRGPMIR